MALIDSDTREALRSHFPVTVTCAVSGGQLVVDSQLVNRGPLNVWIFNVFWDYSEKSVLRKDARNAYVCLEGSELRLGRIVFPYPEGRMIGVAVQPHLSVLNAGASLSEHTALAVPVDEFSCYQPKTRESPTLDATASTLSLTYGIIVGGEEAGFRRDATTGGWHLVDGRLMDRYIEVRSAPVSVKVPIKRRTDDFARF